MNPEYGRVAYEACCESVGEPVASNHPGSPSTGKRRGPWLQVGSDRRFSWNEFNDLEAS